jgi:tetratricopeptide (TPR) repeat protein
MSPAAAVEAVLFAALEKPTPAERNAYLDSACAGDAELRRQVERLLQAHANAGDFLQKPVVELSAAAPEPPRDPNRTTDHEPGGPAGTDESHPAGDGAGGGLPAVPGYRVLREIARGGMGRVLAAHDPSLDRDVALKVLLPGTNADRFVRESKITARLPHPGIPPVHALGTLADGSPFLAMKLIAGQTLAQEMKAADRPRLLQVFLQVCQAVGFAHSRGIVHRDLKPANVMVGAFGEVQVMDWGLAKHLTSRDVPADPSSLEVLTALPEVAGANQTIDHQWPGEATDDQTQAGQVMGTPAYMAPEQARGEVADARADVFALGGMLCAILTGGPPFNGKSTLEVLHHARAADLTGANARLDGCGADAELVALCRACLSPDPAGRPKDGRAVADGMTAYLDGVQERLQAAQRERAVAAAREAEQRKRRQVQRALAATLVLAVLGGTAGAGIYLMEAEKERSAAALRAATEQGRLGRNSDAVAGLLDQAAGALRAGGPARARELLDAAARRADEGGADESFARLARLRADLAVLIELDKVDQVRWITFPKRAVVAARFRAALAGFGLKPESVPAREASARVSGSAVRERLVTALDQWLSAEKLPWVRAVLQGADPHPYRDAVRDAFLAEDGAALGELASRRQAAEQPPGFVAFCCERGAMTSERRRELLLAAVRRRPDDLGLLMVLGISSPAKGGAGERLVWFQAAVGVAPQNGAAHCSLGLALFDAGRPEDALVSLEQATRFAPDYAGTHINLGNVLARQRRFDEAIASFRKATGLEPKNAYAHANLGNALTEQRRFDEAIASFRKASDLEPEDAQIHAHLAEVLKANGRSDAAITHFRKASAYAPENAGFHYSLGDALARQGQADDAIACFRKAIAADPNHASAHGALGDALQGKNQIEAAIASFEKAVAVNPNLAWAHAKLGLALLARGKVQEGIASCRKAVELDPKLSAAHNNLGLGLMQNRQVDEAIACLREAIALEPKNAKAHSNLGEALRGQGRVNEAIECIRKAIVLEPKEAKHHYNLALALDTKGGKDEAIDGYKRAIELDPKLARAHNNLGLVLLLKNQLDEAIASFEKAALLEPKNAKAHAILGEALKHKGKLDAAIARFEKAVDLDPGFSYARHSLATLHFNKGNGYRNSGKADRALASYRKAIELDPKLTGAHYSLGTILCDHKRDYDAAIACFRQAIKLDPKLALAHFCLGIAHSRKGQVDEVIASCRRAVALDPKLAYGHALLSESLLDRGRYAEAREATARVLGLLSKNDPHRARMSQQLQTCERLAILEGRFPRLLKGEEKAASAQESRDVALMCHHKRMNAAAARFFADAYAADPRLGDNLQDGGRYQAACSAALAASGKEEDAAKIDDTQRARLRKQALDWLRADLALLTRQLESHRPADRTRAQQTLRHWQEDRDLAGLRDKDALANLPAEGRAACERLWADVAALRQRAEGK